MKYKSHGNLMHTATRELLAGLKGVELGGAQGRGPTGNYFYVDAINVAPKWSEEEYYDKDPAGRGKIDLYGHAGDIPLKDGRCDFVLSSHVLEHVPDPIAAFQEWERAVRTGGYIVMIVPQPWALKSDTRPLSTVEEIEQAHSEEWTWDHHPGSTVYGGAHGHYWKWNCESLKAMISKWTSHWELVGEEDPDQKVGSGFWLAYRLPKRQE